MTSKRKKRPEPPPPPAAPRRTRAEAKTAGRSSRAAERAAAQAQERKETLRRRLVSGGLVLAALAAVGAYVLVSSRADAELRDALTGGSCEVDDESDRISGGDGHVASPVYTVDPPAGGDHLASVARAGVFDGTAVPPDGQLVHALEHGYVVAWHAPDLPAEQLAQLEEFKTEHEGDVIVAERSSMSTPVAATAWGQRLLCEQVEPAVLDRFAEEYVGKGPEDVPRG